MSTIDDDRQQLLEGQQKARELTALFTKEKEEELRNRAARMFFGEDGIPPHLKEGWAVLERNRKLRAEVGNPLPPGGCLLLGHESVVAGCLAEMHTALANMLKLSVDHIKMKIERTPEGHIKPVADVRVPTDWLLPIVTKASQSPDEAAQEYIRRCVETASVYFRQSVTERLGYCERRRVDVEQPIAPWGQSAEG